MNSGCPGAGENNGVGRAATRAYARHATEQEYVALPLAHQPIDGIAHKSVYACDHCAEDVPLFCEHPVPQAEPCGTCGAGGTDPCLRRDGATPLHFTHADRREPVPERCVHAHRPDCPIFTDCQCASSDTPPVRPKHPAADGHQVDISRLLIPEHAAQMLLAQAGIHWWQVRQVASVWTQDTRPALRAQYVTLDEAGHFQFDEDGHEKLGEIVIVLEEPQG
jgi:hypothetical protein